jgi:hypothetical protein
MGFKLVRKDNVKIAFSVAQLKLILMIREFLRLLNQLQMNDDFFSLILRSELHETKSRTRCRSETEFFYCGSIIAYQRC